MTEYHLTCSNRSRLHGVFALYFDPPASNGPGTVFPIFAMARPAGPNTRVTFRWSTPWCFCWGEAGTLRGGGRFDAAQFLPADLWRLNLVDLTADQYGAPMFTNLRTDGPPGALTIRQLNTLYTVPVSIGIGMQEFAVAAVPANANLTTTFRPVLDQINVVFGDYAMGEIVEIYSATGALAVQFSATMPKQHVALAADNILKLL